jgi:Na+:H+ antiporter, NhaA family
MMEHSGTSAIPRWPHEPVDRLVAPLTRFLHVEAASGALLLVMTVTAVGLANSPLSEQFLGFWETPLRITVGGFTVSHSLQTWINDGFMAIFFFVVGLEVKREVVQGELRDLRAATLPIVAALGGMLVPAGLYLISQWGEPGARGWGIPMATDIAFVVGCLAILGTRVPHSLRILLLTLAIADDIGAIFVIAIGYSRELNLHALGLGMLGIALVKGLTQFGVRNVAIYIFVGTAVWLAFHASGVHATIAGVILGFLTPAHPWISEGHLADVTRRVGAFLEGDPWNDIHERREMLRTMERAARETLSPLERLETTLHPWVSFVIMPLFALANAGVSVQLAAVREPVAIAVMIGLVIGKPVGIVLLSWLAVWLRLAKLPGGMSWSIMAAGGVLAGIGFTMSLFLANLALQKELLAGAKIGILAGSAISATLGLGLLFWRLPKPLEDTVKNG